jgi:hypothetical protein
MRSNIDAAGISQEIRKGLQQALLGLKDGDASAKDFQDLSEAVGVDALSGELKEAVGDPALFQRLVQEFDKNGNQKIDTALEMAAVLKATYDKKAEAGEGAKWLEQLTGNIEGAEKAGSAKGSLAGLDIETLVTLLSMKKRELGLDAPSPVSRNLGPLSGGGGGGGGGGPSSSAPGARGSAPIVPTGAEAGKYRALLDLIKSKESAGLGYDAMNQGGSAGGHVAHGSGSGEKILGKKLTEMTVGEVMQHQAAGRLHAAGAYQIIGKTLKGLVDRGVLDPNQKFDVNAQDRAAIGLIEGRRGQGVTGIGNEWIGLQYADKAALRAAMSEAGLA